MLKKISRWISRTFKSRSLKSEKIVQTKWHLACKWIAASLDAVDLVVLNDANIAVVKDKRGFEESFNGDTPFTSCGFYLAGKEVSPKSAWAISLPVIFGEDDIGKDIEKWSASQAEDFIKLVCFCIPSKRERCEVGSAQFRWNGYRTNLEFVKALPLVNSEEEMFMRASILLGEAEEDENGESSNALKK